MIVSAETKGRSSAGARLSYIEFINCLLRVAVVVTPTVTSVSGQPSSRRVGRSQHRDDFSHPDVIQSLLNTADFNSAADAAFALATSVDRAFRVLMVMSSRVVAWRVLLRV